MTEKRNLAQKVPTDIALIVFGTDRRKKRHASRFGSEIAARALEAARSMGMRTLPVVSDEQREIEPAPSAATPLGLCSVVFAPVILAASWLPPLPSICHSSMLGAVSATIARPSGPIATPVGRPLAPGSGIVASSCHLPATSVKR